MQQRVFVALACLCVILLVGGTASAARPQPVEDPGTGKWGYMDPRTKRLVIPYRYAIADRFNAQGAAFALADDGWVYIDVRGTVLARPFLFDNGPDDFSEGLARCVSQGKMGYFNKKGEIVIPAVYDFGLPFEGGLAPVCVDCVKEYDGEHYRVVRGSWGCVNKKGVLVRPLSAPGPDCAK